jgi:hypothetical protein
VGSENYNEKLLEPRAEAVRIFVAQQVSPIRRRLYVALDRLRPFLPLRPAKGSTWLGSIMAVGNAVKVKNSQFHRGFVTPQDGWPLLGKPMFHTRIALP